MYIFISFVFNDLLLTIVFEMIDITTKNSEAIFD